MCIRDRFSKAGRMSNEKHSVFLKKDEILYNKKKVFVVSPFPTFSNTAEKEKQLSKPPESAIKNPFKIEDEPPKKDTKTMRRVQSAKPGPWLLQRKERFEGSKQDNPPFGLYTPKYQMVFSREPVLSDFGKETGRKEREHSARPGTAKPGSAPRNEEATDDELVPEKQPRKLKLPIEFHKQKSREDILKGLKGNPHEKRFEYVDWPKTFSKNKEVKAISFENLHGREDNKMYKRVDFAPDYKPNFEYGKKRILAFGMKFEKMSGRKPTHKESYTKNETRFDYDDYANSETTQLFVRPRSANFKAYQGRDAEPTDPLPSFMQVRLNLFQVRYLSLIHI
eukprot:TRINITY_DN6596_c0_g1_i3.p1 TRINITY_DN6596_c0_g1~~TRINITY_DN6596_c0_g1_i3.p1  ORF type:complete len:368 (+),score=65.20 TRINITY_DN6596_c0_g1_i3:95-1105(+)